MVVLFLRYSYLLYCTIMCKCCIDLLDEQGHATCQCAHWRTTSMDFCTWQLYWTPIMPPLLYNSDYRMNMSEKTWCYSTYSETQMVYDFLDEAAVNAVSVHFAIDTCKICVVLHSLVPRPFRFSACNIEKL